MNSHKLSLKLLADGVDAKVSAAIVPIFHSWIQNQSLVDHILIDVADYEHVPNGPGTVLVSHEANIHLDHEEHPGLLYIRKQPVTGAATFRDRLAAVFRATFLAAQKMESDRSVVGLKFRTNEVNFRINDRLAAPNNEETFNAISSVLQSFLADLYKSDVAIEHRHDPLRLFEVRIKASVKPSITELLSRLDAIPAAV